MMNKIVQVDNYYKYWDTTIYFKQRGFWKKMNEQIEDREIVRVNNWDEIYSEIQKMKNGEIK